MSCVVPITLLTLRVFSVNIFKQPKYSSKEVKIVSILCFGGGSGCPSRVAPPKAVCEACLEANGICIMQCRAAFVYDNDFTDAEKAQRLKARYDVGYYKKTKKPKFPLVIPAELLSLIQPKSK